MAVMNNLSYRLLLVGLLLTFRMVGSAQTGWSLQPAGITKDLHSLFMAGFPDRIYASGDSGIILFTSDLGLSWTSIPTNTSASINGIGYANTDTGFAVGDGGTILKVSQTSSMMLNSGTRQNLHDVAVPFDNQNRTAIAVGDSGKILRTIDRGASWSVRASGTNKSLNSIFLETLTLIYVVGDSGTILKSTNAGSTWIPKTIPEPYRSTDFYSVRFVADTGWAVGENGAILVSRNAGGLWLPEDSPVLSSLRGEFFFPNFHPLEFNMDLGWIVGDSGKILKTQDGGSTWFLQSSGTSERLNGVIFADSLTGIAVGANGTILRTLTGGISGPRFSVLPTSLRFSDVIFGTIQSATMTVRNDGVVPLNIFSVTSDNSDFMVSPPGGIIQAFSSQQFKVTFDATSIGSEAATITFTYNGPGSPDAFTIYGSSVQEEQPSGWYWQNPAPQGNGLFDIQWANGKTGFAVGEIGTIMKTTNAGESWSVKPHTASLQTPLTSISFSGPDTGTAVGTYGAILRTTDGGDHWVRQVSGTTNNLTDVSFAGVAIGTAVSGVLSSPPGYGSIHRTTDGGSTWITQYQSPKYLPYRIVTLNANLAVAVGGYFNAYPSDYTVGIILRTSDGGAHWVKQVDGPFGFLNGVAFLDEEIGVAVGSYVTILRTQDGGITWNTVPSGTTESLLGIAFSNSSVGIISGVSGSIMHTTDGGQTWSGGARVSSSFLNISMLDGNFGLAVGSNGYSYSPGNAIFRTTNGGVDWVEQPSSVTRRTLRAISFVDSQTCMAAGDSGTVLRTSDGGAHWFQQLQGTLFVKLGLSFRGSSFLDGATGTIVGDQGTIIHTTDGGQQWSTEASQTSNQLNAVSFLNEAQGYAVGNSGTILRTTDGGSVLMNESGLTLSNLNAVSLDAPDQIMIVGDHGTILYSSDGGGMWTSQSSGITYNLFAVSVHADTAIVTGEHGTILRSTNKGDTWTMQASGSNSHLRSIQSPNSSVTWIVGDNGTILRTTNGGSTWTGQSSGTSEPLYAVSFSGINSGTVVGASGTILHTSTGGVLGVREGFPPHLPPQFALEQNYPNPFNPVTHFQFSLANRQLTILKVYDVLGREVTTIVNAVKPPGSYTVDWDASNVPSGIYFYQLRAGDFSSVKKMLLIR